jgi:dTDP-glucose 4,6-dehydratase
MTRVLVTGSLGTLGKPLVTELKARGHEVWQTDCTHSDEELFMRSDVGDYRQIERVFSMCRPEYVFHLAAEFGRLNGEEHYEQVWRTNTIGTRNILELGRDSWAQGALYGAGKPPKIIFASSSEIYGEAPSLDRALSEDMDNAGPLSNDYAISKWANELQIRSHIKRYGTDVMTLRFFNAYGPGEYYHPYRSVCALFCYAALMDLPITVFNQYHRVFMYIDDFIPTLANCIERYVPGETINIGGSEYREVFDVADIAYEYVGRSRDKWTVMPSDQYNVTNKRPDIRKARNLLGHNPTVILEEGIPITIDWMRTVYKRVGILTIDPDWTVVDPEWPSKPQGGPA